MCSNCRYVAQPIAQLCDLFGLISPPLPTRTSLLVDIACRVRRRSLLSPLLIMAALIAHIAGITVVTGGADDVEAFYDHLVEAGEDHREWVYKDLREDLPKDPSLSVGHREDGTYAQTQRVVITQSGFMALLLWLVNLAFGIGSVGGHCYTKFFLHCRTGCHRASTVGAFLVEVLNYMMYNGNRQFNAQHFPLHKVYGRTGRFTLLKSAMSWASEPWDVKEGGRRSRKDLYAYEACMLEPTAAANWLGVYKQIDEWFPLTPSPPTVPPTLPPPIVSLTPTPPNVPPPPPPRERASSSSRVAPEPAYDHRGAESLPDWATFDKDPVVWWQLLDSLGCDENSRQSLFCLSQFSDLGYEAANSAISKLIKKKADGERVDNASALLHTLCKNARHELDPRYIEGKTVSKRARHW